MIKISEDKGARLL